MLCLSTPSHKYDVIRPPMHPGLLRCSSVKYYGVFSLLASCRPGASTPSMRHRIYVREYLDKELLMHIIAYNLIRVLIMTTAQAYSVDNFRMLRPLKNPRKIAGI